MQFYSNSGHLKSHNNIDLEIKLMLPHNQIFSGTTHVPTSSSTRRVNSCIRGTCKAWTEQLFIISIIRAYTDFHTYVLGVLFKAWNIFLCFIFLFCFLNDSKKFSRTQDEKIGRMTYLDTLAPPKLEWSSVGLPSWPIFFCMQCKIKRMHLREFKHAMMWKGRLCENINYPICKWRNG